MRVLIQVVMLSGIAATFAATPVIPEAIRVPAGAKLVLSLHATGVQVYQCGVDGAGKPQWTFKAPEAELHDRRAAVVGHHAAGPVWKYRDGSEVTGKASAQADAPDPDSIPWLLVSATGHNGSGLLARVSSIQRINTKGGKAPAAAGCTAANSGTESRSAYSADYLFFAR